jgi:hypothetical protein
MINNLACTLIALLLTLTTQLYAQTGNSKNKSPFPVKYTSLVDEKIILKTITLAPVYDNVNNIYADPIQKLLVDLLQSDKVWGYAEFPDFNKKIFIEKFDNQPNDVIEVLTKTNTQGLLTAFITKGPRGLNAKLKLFTQDQGLILAEESFQDINTFEVSKLRENFVTMYYNIKNKLPYRGYVLSRRGLDVTLNLGSMNGVRLGQELALAQILKVNRHPKLKSMVGVEKEIIAKVKVTQVEPYLSFAQIIFEKETGVVAMGSKVLPSEYVAYPIPQINPQGNVVGDFPAQTASPPRNSEVDADAPRLDRNMEEAKENLLDKNNSLGIFTAQGVITQYKESSELANSTSASTSNNFAPGVYLGVQLYLMKNLFVDFNTQMNFFSGDNLLSGSSPFHLSYTFTRYAASVGYDYFLVDEETPSEADAIKLTGALGLASFKTDVSNTTPTALTSTQTDSLVLQLKATMPLTPEYPMAVGARFDIFLSPKLSESPVNSGDSKPSITSLGIFGLYTVSDKLRVRADIGITNINSSFSGAATRANPAKSTSIQTLNEQVGIEYLF